MAVKGGYQDNSVEKKGHSIQRVFRKAQPIGTHLFQGGTDLHLYLAWLVEPASSQSSHELCCTLHCYPGGHVEHVYFAS